MKNRNYTNNNPLGEPGLPGARKRYSFLSGLKSTMLCLTYHQPTTTENGPFLALATKTPNRAKLETFPAAPDAVAKRPIEDMVAEILEFSRSESNRQSTPVFLASPTMITNPLVDPLSGGILQHHFSGLYPAVAGESIFGSNPARMVSVAALGSDVNPKPGAESIEVTTSAKNLKQKK